MGTDEGKLAIYSRKSKFTGKGESIGNQIELCKEFVRGIYGAAYVERCEVFEDEGFSGGNLKRPAFQEMMRQVRQKQYRAIIVYRLDRISRNINDFTGLIDELTKLGVSFISIREQFDTSTPMGRAMMFIISVFSQLERETIAERIRDNMLELAKTGRWLGGNAPTGFRSEAVSKVTIDGKTRKSHKLAVIPEEAEIPRLIFDRYIQTDSLTAVEAELLQRRVKTKQGRDFTRFAIKAILQNPVYMTADAAAYAYFQARHAEVCAPPAAFDGHRGIMAYNRTAQGKGKATTLLPVSAWIIAPGEHPGLIPSKQWIAVQEALERNKSKAYRKARTNEALLTGLLFCTCGARMYPKITKRKNDDGAPVYSYVCKLKERSKSERCAMRNASGNVLDAAVLGQVKRLAEERRSFISRMEESRPFYAGHRDQSEAELSQLRTELAANEKSIAGLIDALADVENAALRHRICNRIDAFTRRSREIEERIEALIALAASGSLTDTEVEMLLPSMTDKDAVFSHMSTQERRAAFRSIVRQVIWDGETAHVFLWGSEDAQPSLPGPCAVEAIPRRQGAE